MYYLPFGQTGLRISALALGTGSFGTGWGHGASREESRAIFEAYRAAGGNFIDTANIYQLGDSEEFLGGFIGHDRDDIVLSTKFGLNGGRDSGLQTTGNSRKAIVQCVEGSLKRLNTDRIDILWVHVPDSLTPTDEIARALDDLVRSGKILYAGLSNFPAWRIATAATIAELRGWAPIRALQTEYSLVERGAERELLPMAAANGLAVLGWSPLGGGLLTGKYRRGETGRREGLGIAFRDETDARTSATLDCLIEIAEELGCSPGQAAIAWTMSKGVTPLIGPRTTAQLLDNLGALDVALEEAHLAALDAASAIELGSPHDKFGRSAIGDNVTAGKSGEFRWPQVMPR